jgi:bifunctional non-homologous end joining protein LigD
MLCAVARPPFHRDGWVYEEKYDGWRILAFKDGGRVRLISRTGREHARTFPQVAAAIAALPAERLVLDGEVCAFDQGLVSHMHLLRPEPGALATPPMYAAFDCLVVDSRDLRALPLRDRRAALEDRLAGAALELFVARRLPDNGAAAWAVVIERGYEGMVAKDDASRYVAGDRSTNWRKVKVRRAGEFVIAGVARDRDGYIALLVGVPEGRGLRFAGVVTFGVTRRALGQLFPILEPLARRTSPFQQRIRMPDAIWLEPRVRAELTYSEMVKGVLRDPVFRGAIVG